jgi:hypothetical protein
MADKIAYLVTGSIGPQFEPRLFTTKRVSEKYVAMINQYGREHDVWPKFEPCIEKRWPSDMQRMNLETSL